MSLDDFIQNCSVFLRERRGKELSNCLSMYNASLRQVSSHWRQNLSLKGKLPSPYDDLILQVIAAAAHFETQIETCFTFLAETFRILCSFLREEKSWIISVLLKLSKELRQIAEKVDANQQKDVTSSKRLEETESLLKRAYSLVVNDRLAAEDSKKMASLELVNQLFRIYFKLNTVHLCRSLIRQVEGPSFPSFELFPITHQVTFCFFAGRLRLFDDDFKATEQHLGFAFRNCPQRYWKSRRQILMYLIPARIVLGKLPSTELIHKYHLSQYYGRLVRCVRIGDVAGVDASLEQWEEFFIRRGVYFVLEHLKLIALRVLFKRIYQLLGSTRLKLPDLQCALKVAGYEMDIDELECCLANLIYQGYIKGYIAHQRQILVVSKVDPFPHLKNVVAK
ncbi:PCI domain-containing protein 2 [Galdieria sulphuraria]|uniref:COP9 signalosome subunit Csn12-like protein n=1 Tax=Galdieria sulphuraria TaxID=130081 RepID=M2Y6A2_GALSU|nr:COP9 signalosome subunit Csn12-like protein [Galdieria sulphuraria]EME31558.1 COP9 signalosome subunit Csn12-like protein [Galdieria sulphuraria]GJD08844.1 PCI domain-containing protein 2 [Galdieria sulphuraria]|eukprot:XP_005708078.1 COP9 signalosome subunit Csn12-like protein [Galdieria sulphuraria]